MVKKIILITAAMHAVLGPTSTSPALVMPADVVPRQAPEGGVILISMFERPLGREEYRVEPDAGGYRLVSNIDFTDRGTRIQLASSLRFTADLTPLRFESKGRSYRFVNVDAVFDLGADGTAFSRNFGDSNRVKAPARYFAGRGYPPFAVQAMLVRYWERHGRQPTIRLFPGDSTNAVAVRFRGIDTVRIDARPVALRRYSVDGLVWGREALWLDERRRFAAAITRVHILPMEAVREGLGGALPALEEIATRDRLADLGMLSERVVPIARNDFALVGARLIDGTGRAPLDDATVLVRAGRIAAAGPRASVSIPAGTRVISASRKVIVPGLWDLHGHVSQVEWAPAYLAAGVTTVRDMGGVNQFLIALRRALASPRGLGPRLLLAGLIDGGGPNAMGTVIATTPEQGRRAVDDYRAAGFDQIKIYGSLAPDVVGAVTRRAHEFGMHVTGHVPGGMSLEQAVDSGMDEIAHIPVMRGEPGTPDMRSLIELLVRHHTVADPTVAWNELLGRSNDTPIERFEPGILESPPPLAFNYNSVTNPVDRAQAQAGLRRDLAIVKALHDAGVPIVAGTDGGVPGHSLLRTLELYVQAGLTPSAALATATTIPARVMGLEKDAGTIEAGKRADLLVLDADPLDNISNIRKARWVVANGRLHDPAALWRSAGFTPRPRVLSPVTK